MQLLNQVQLTNVQKNSVWHVFCQGASLLFLLLLLLLRINNKAIKMHNDTYLLTSLTLLSLKIKYHKSNLSAAVLVSWFLNWAD